MESLGIAVMLVCMYPNKVIEGHIDASIFLGNMISNDRCWRESEVVCTVLYLLYCGSVSLSNMLIRSITAQVRHHTFAWGDSLIVF